MKPTFNQISALILALACLVGMMLTYFFPHSGESSTEIITCLTGVFSASVMYLIKASSDATHDANNSRMIDALANSAPVKEKPPIVAEITKTETVSAPTA